ncbi:MAG: SprT-like domain-containing protein [Bacteroidales bacterium]|nr:SprT-like domain-containing protein [Bacteroidales bacterium]
MEDARVTRYKTVLGRYLPAEAVEPMFQMLTQDNSVKLHVTRERQSKLGDYRCPQSGHPYHEISVNGNINPYFFLLVLLHELAHLNTWKLHGNRVQPHGREWQGEYARMLAAYSGLFPVEVRRLIERYVRRLPLDRATGRAIEQQLRRYDVDYVPGEDLTLDDLPLGSMFRLKNGRDIVFRSLEKRRTRYRCVDVATNMPYLVAGSAPVCVVR